MCQNPSVCWPGREVMGCENYLVACACENLQIRESTGRAAVLIGFRYLLVDYQDPPTHGGNLSFTMLPRKRNGAVYKNMPNFC